MYWIITYYKKNIFGKLGKPITAHIFSESWRAAAEKISSRSKRIVIDSIIAGNAKTPLF